MTHTRKPAARAYDELEHRFGRAAAFREALAILSWDMQTMMPRGAAEARGVAMSTLETEAHAIVSDGEVKRLIEEAEGDATLSGWQRANVREMKREHAHASAVDPQLVEKLSQAGTASTMAWREARPKNDWAAYVPHLERVLLLVREVASQKAAALACTPYDALIDQFEPGMTAQRVNEIFAPLRAELPGLADAVIARQGSLGAALPLVGPFAVGKQKALGERVMGILGYDFERGRLDTSAHPFCGGATDDVRITTRYREEEFVSSLFGIVHETGHALYEQNLPKGFARQPVGRARGMAVHESQSLFYEMQVARSDEFVGFLAPLMREAFGGEGEAWGAANLLRSMRRVKRGLIRVDSDEVTYPTHVMLRFEIEQELLSGELGVAELPARWRGLMHEVVGLSREEAAAIPDKDGVMQDIHWTDGAFGYFPSYTLGALIAAQLMVALERAVPDVRGQFARGDLAATRAFLGEAIHARGSLLSTDELVLAATGEPLSARAFLAHVKRRYLG